MRVIKLLTNILFYILLFFIYWMQSYTWISIFISYLFQINFTFIRVMMIVGAVIALAVCFLIRFIQKKYPIVFKLLMLIHLVLLFNTVHTVSSFDEPIKVPVKQVEQ
ncbi:hypothetical protein [Paenibacillus sp. MMO-58]|uniref:hypothetical protein n=1 Tax=Paenibacillus sp. MMO-58 TaxID=3081290 RepID=UPI00301A167B